MIRCDAIYIKPFERASSAASVTPWGFDLCANLLPAVSTAGYREGEPFGLSCLRSISGAGGRTRRSSIFVH